MHPKSDDASPPQSQPRSTFLSHIFKKPKNQSKMAKKSKIILLKSNEIRENQGKGERLKDELKNKRKVQTYLDVVCYSR